MSTEQGKTMADALSEQWDQMETPDEPEAPPVEEAPAAEPAETASVPETPEAPARARDEAGKFAPTPKPAKAAKPQTAAPGAVAPAEGTSQAQPPTKPPSKWFALAREDWTKLPRSVQDQILKREGDVSRLVQENATAQQTHTQLSRVLEPFVPHLRAAGVQPLQHIETMFRTDYQLRTAPKPQQAALMAQLISTYGVDLEALNDALIKGGGGQTPQPRQSSAEFRDPRLDALLSQAERQRAQQVTQSQQAREAEISAFGEKAEFFEDVRETMAHIYEVHEAAVSRAMAEGRQPPAPLTLDKAYQQALTFPEHAGIMAVQQQRKAEEQKKAQAASAAKARAAGSSIRTQGAPPQAPKRGSVRDELEQGWERLQGQQ